MTLSILGAVILTVATGGRCDIAGWGVILIVATGRRCDIVGVIPIVATGRRCDHRSPLGGVIPIVATGGRFDIEGCNSYCEPWAAL